MSFLETPRFPDNVAFGATGGPSYLTDIVFLSGGAESRNQTWDQARATYEVSHAARLPAEYVPLRDFFRAVKGRTHGFRFKDWLDFEATVANGVLTAGVGTGLPTYQLGKNYVAGALSETRTIRKPVAGTVAIYRGGVLSTAGSGAGQYAIDTATGIITWVADATQTIASVLPGSSLTEVNMSGVLTGAAAGKKVYFRNIGGTIGDRFNDEAWTINSVASGTILRIASDTTGMTATPATGNAYMYPQASETLTWAGQFDVPARFDTDRMQAVTISKSGGQHVVDWDSIPVIEIRT